MSEIKSILVVAAHPDDEILGCGATIAKLSTAGTECSVLVLGPQASERPGQTFDDKDVLEQCRAAIETVGYKHLETADFPETRFDTVPLRDIATAITKAIQFFEPEIVLTHSGGDLNVDHQLAFQATLVATRPQPNTPGGKVKAVYSYEVPSSSEWAFGKLEPRFQPNTFMSVTNEQLNRKTEALYKYAAEVRDFPHPRSAAGLEVIAARWGTIIGVEYAEAFELVRKINI